MSASTVASEPEPDPPMVLGEVYPEESPPKLEINPDLLTRDSPAFQRLSESLKMGLVQSELSPKEILTSRSYKPPELVEYLLRDFDKYGVDVDDSNILFTNQVDSTERFTQQ